MIRRRLGRPTIDNSAPFDAAAYFNDPEFGARRRLARTNNYRCLWCGSTVADCADRECPGDPDPTPYCSGCGAKRMRDCHCGPRADND